MTSPLVRNTRRLPQYSLVGYGMSDFGLLLPTDVSGSPISYVWVLSSTVIPQPTRTRGIWTTTGVWGCSEIFYK